MGSLETIGAQATRPGYTYRGTDFPAEGLRRIAGNEAIACLARDAEHHFGNSV